MRASVVAAQCPILGVRALLVDALHGGLSRNSGLM